MLDFTIYNPTDESAASVFKASPLAGITPSDLLPFELIDAIFQLLSPLGPTYSDDFRVARTALARCARTCHAYHKIALTVLWKEQYLSCVCKAVLSNFAMGCVKWPEEEVYWEDASSESDDDANEDMAVGVDLNEYPHVYVSG